MRLYIQRLVYMQTILFRCRQKDRKAQMELYRLHSRRLYFTCLRLLSLPEEAEEAMQDSFIKIFDHLDSFKDGTNFEAWSVRIAVRTAIDRLRKRKVLFEPLQDNLLEDTGEDPAEENYFRRNPTVSIERIRNALGELPQGYRVVLTMHWFEGFDFEEMAQILQLKPSSIRSQYVRGKQKLLERIQIERNES